MENEGGTRKLLKIRLPVPEIFTCLNLSITLVPDTFSSAISAASTLSPPTIKTIQAHFPPKMPIQISPLTPKDIPSAVHCIQAAFADDPYNHWIFHRENFSLARNTHSLSIRCKWGIEHALFHVAKDTSDSEGKVLGVACWLPPSNAKEPQTWKSWFGDWWLWWEQVKVMLHDS